MRNLLLFLLAVLLASSCQSLERLERVSPLSDDVAKDRVNLWPLFYKNGEQVATLSGASKDKLVATIKQHK